MVGFPDGPVTVIVMSALQAREFLLPFGELSQ